jgi:hypothetical protein
MPVDRTIPTARIRYYTRPNDGAWLDWWIAGLTPAPTELQPVPPDRCQTSPRGPSELPPLTGTPTAAYPAVPAHGEYLNTEFATVLEVTAVIEQVVACINAGDRDRLAALVTDDFLRRYPEVGAALAVAVELPQRQLSIERVASIYNPLGPLASAEGPRWRRVTVVITDLDRPGEAWTAELVLRGRVGADPDWRVDAVAGDAWLVDAFQLESP